MFWTSKREVTYLFGRCVQMNIARPAYIMIRYHALLSRWFYTSHELSVREFEKSPGFQTCQHWTALIFSRNTSKFGRSGRIFFSGRSKFYGLDPFKDTNNHEIQKCQKSRSKQNLTYPILHRRDYTKRLNQSENSLVNGDTEEPFYFVWQL